MSTSTCECVDLSVPLSLQAHCGAQLAATSGGGAATSGGVCACAQVPLECMHVMSCKHAWNVSCDYNFDTDGGRDTFRLVHS